MYKRVVMSIQWNYMQSYLCIKVLETSSKYSYSISIKQKCLWKWIRELLCVGHWVWMPWDFEEGNNGMKHDNSKAEGTKNGC